MPDRLGVLRDPSYRAFWVGQSISFVGSHVTELALPLTAVLLLNAGPAQWDCSRRSATSRSC